MRKHKAVTVVLAAVLILGGCSSGKDTGSTDKGQTEVTVKTEATSGSPVPSVEGEVAFETGEPIKYSVKVADGEYLEVGFNIKGKAAFADPDKVTIDDQKIREEILRSAGDSFAVVYGEGDNAALYDDIDRNRDKLAAKIAEDLEAAGAPGAVVTFDEFGVSQEERELIWSREL